MIKFKNAEKKQNSKKELEKTKDNLLGLWQGD